MRKNINLDKNIAKNLSCNIKHYRKAKGFTYTELAKQAKLPYSTVHSIETRVIKNPGLITVFKIANVFNLTLDEIISDLSKKGEIII